MHIKDAVEYALEELRLSVSANLGRYGWEHMENAGRALAEEYDLDWDKTPLPSECDDCAATLTEQDQEDGCCICQKCANLEH